MVRFNAHFSTLKNLLLLAITALPALVSAQNCGVSVSEYQLQLGSGWGAYTLVSTLTRPRQITFDQQGRLLVADVGRGIQQLTLGSNGNCITVSNTKLLIQDSQLNHAVEFSPDGKRLWASSLNAVYVWDYDQATGNISNKRTVVSGMNFGGHPTRTVLHPRSKPGVILVQEGSIDNLDMACNTQGGCLIKEFDIATIPSTAYDYINGGRVLGWGLRNSVGIAEHSDGGIWSVENSADNIRRNNVDVHQNNPAEEMNYHGVLSSSSNSFFGKNYGYPTCFAVWNPSEIPQVGSLQTGDQFLFQPNSTFTDATCQQRFQKPYLTFPAHTAPLDIKFYKPSVTGGSCEQNTQYGGLGCDYVDDAFVAFHGSWNRDVPIGYNFAHIPFSNGQPVAAANSQNGFTSIVSAPNLSQCPSRCFRPVGIAFDPKGRILVSSDDRGDIIVVTRAVTASPSTSTGGPGSTSTPTTSIPTSTYTPPPTTFTSTPTPTPTPTPTTPPIANYGQCGGNNWTGGTNCQSGKCVKLNDWYSQCQP